jgi:hypothetical protein
LKNLLVLGCSISDYTHVDRTWGEILAKQYNLNYIHEAAGCGSNWRMWRRAFDLIDNNIITKQDVIVVQYTELIRREFWSPYQNESRPLHGSNGKSNMTEAYDDGHITRYKIDAEQLGDYTKKEQAFFKSYTRMLNPKFELESFRMMHNMFQGYMSDKGFANLYFLKCADFGVLYEYNKFHKIYQNNYIHAPDAFDNHLPNDQGHMNQQGHQLLADLVYQKLSI